jgi:hypothetical protein
VLYRCCVPVVGGGGFVVPVLPPSVPLAVSPVVFVGVIVGAFFVGELTRFVPLPVPVLVVPLPVLVGPVDGLRTSIVFLSPASAAQGVANTNAIATARIGSRMVISDLTPHCEE